MRMKLQWQGSLLKGIRSLGDSGMLTYEEFISGGRSIDEDRKQQVKTLVKYGKGLCGEFSRLLQSFLDLHGIPSHMHQISLPTGPM